MNKKRLVAALAALSLAGAAFAGTNAPQQARQTTQNATALQTALNGNSYAGFVPHNFIKGVDGLWLAGFGQMTAAYNSQALINSAGAPEAYTNDGSSFTIGLPHAMVLMGYQSNNVGMFVNVNYANVPSTAKTSGKIQLASSKTVPEAYLTYKINDMFAVKAGKFNTDFGSYDPTAALVSVGTGVNAFGATGVEAVVATNGFHGSVAGVMLDGATKTATTGLTNDARPNAFIVNAGYDMPFQGGTAGVEGSFNSKSAATPTSVAEWTLGAHFTNNAFAVKGDVFTINAKSGKKPYIWDGSVDYKLGNRFGHGMVVGAYGSYLSATTTANYGLATVGNTHWLLGAKFGYTLNRYSDAVVYAQHAKMRKNTTKDNNTLMLALTIKV